MPTTVFIGLPGSVARNLRTFCFVRSSESLLACADEVRAAGLRQAAKVARHVANATQSFAPRFIAVPPKLTVHEVSRKALSRVPQ
jgi:hypothetical protein